MTDDRLRLRIAGGVARLTLTRPAAGNAIDLQFVEECGAALDVLEADRSVRVLVIDAEGRNFTVGGDLKFLQQDLDHFADVVDHMLSSWHGTVLPRFDTLPFPVVASVQGSAAGGGLGLVWCADIVVAAENLRIVTGFDKLGLSGDGGSSWYLPRLIGHRRAARVMLLGETVRADLALEWGLVSAIVPLPDLADATEAVVARLVAGPTAALARTRALLLASDGRTHTEGLAEERRAMKACGEEPDVREGVTAFAEGRPPQFAGAPEARS